MSFVVTDIATFISPVKASLPADHGKTRTVQFNVIFKALPKDEVDELLKRIRDSAKAVAEDPSATPLKDREILDELLVGFGSDLLEEDRTPMAFTKANVDRLCRIWLIEAAMVKSFFTNYVNAAAKN